MFSIKKQYQKILLKIKKAIRAKKTPHDIALGFMVGTFVAILPTPGFSIALGLTIAFLHRRMSKIAMAAAYAIWNPLVTAPVYAISYKFGDLLFSASEVFRFKLEFWNHALNFTRRFIVGAGLIAIIAALISYLIVRMLASQYQERKAKRSSVKSSGSANFINNNNKKGIQIKSKLYSFEEIKI